MIKVSKLQRSNILSAKKMWNSVPEANVMPYLLNWRSFSDEHKNLSPTCNTIACFGGWCAYWPKFQAQGLYGGNGGGPVFYGNDSMYETSAHLFGCSNMFVSRGFNNSDMGSDPATSDWQVVMDRIDHLIQNSTVTL